MIRRGLGLLLASSLLLPPAVWAQATVNSAHPDPLDPAAAVPALTYHSALAAYPIGVDQTVGVWREANDRVERIGGWQAYAREAYASETAPAEPLAEPAADGTRPPSAHTRHHP